MVNKVIQKAIQAVGSQKKLANAVGVSQPNVWCWLHNKKRVSPENVTAIVDATGGEVQGYEIRPDLPKLFPHPEQAA
ncbi:transcriptional regulator [Serratia fonticola]|uniref:transcriptional regulator n=1 Tax=Serratia fonticola TaxID=47917 RepID=UPI0034C5D90B